MLHFLNLIRWKNLLVIALAQIALKLGFLNVKLEIETALTNGQFIALVLATVCLAAAGYIINDIYDVETDHINNPDKQIVGKHIHENFATNLFIVLNVLGVALGFYVANSVGKNAFATFFVVISILLYVYATYLKGTVLIGNIVISLLIASTILIVGVFDLVPMITVENRAYIVLAFEFILEFALFAFLINLVREMIKDLEDVDGDYKADLKTLPIVIGRDRAAKLAFFIALLPLAGITYYTIVYLSNNQALILYYLFLIIGPLMYATIKILTAKSKKDYAILSIILKVILVLGILSIFLF